MSTLTARNCGIQNIPEPCPQNPYSGAPCKLGIVSSLSEEINTGSSVDTGASNSHQPTVLSSQYISSSSQRSQLNHTASNQSISSQVTNRIKDNLSLGPGGLPPPITPPHVIPPSTNPSSGSNTPSSGCLQPDARLTESINNFRSLDMPTQGALLFSKDITPFFTPTCDSNPQEPRTRCGTTENVTGPMDAAKRLYLPPNESTLSEYFGLVQVDLPYVSDQSPELTPRIDGLNPRPSNCPWEWTAREPVFCDNGGRTAELLNDGNAASRVTPVGRLRLVEHPAACFLCNNISGKQNTLCRECYYKARPQNIPINQANNNSIPVAPSDSTRRVIQRYGSQYLPLNRKYDKPIFRSQREGICPYGYNTGPNNLCIPQDQPSGSFYEVETVQNTPGQQYY